MRRLSDEMIAAAHRSGHKQKVLAAESGESVSNICKWLAGRAVPYTPRAERAVGALCELLGMPLDGALIEERTP